MINSGVCGVFVGTRVLRICRISGMRNSVVFADFCRRL